jgi:hypothetical protein
MRGLCFIAFLLWLSACERASPPAAIIPGTLDAIAQDYVILTLELGEREPGYVDAYYGPPEWAEAAKAKPRDSTALAAGAAELLSQLDSIDTAALDADSRQRHVYLRAHLTAALARSRMLDGERLAFADEAEALFGVRPELRPLTVFDEVLARIDAIIPGEAPLPERVTSFRERYTIPSTKLDAVMQAAIVECRSRTLRRIALPANERFTLEFVTDKPWSGYNYYQGDANSLIQINIDLPIQISRAIDLGCHEGYPGHHVYNTLLERTFVKDKGWVEMSIFPLYSPMALIAEGSANYGVDLAFPLEERIAFEKQVLYPLAGLEPALADDLIELQELLRQLAGAEYTIADDYLSGRINQATAIALLQTYGLTSPPRAEQRLAFIETYRSYIINYVLGRDMVEAWVERQGADHWMPMEQLLSSQLLPVDLLE